MTADEKKETGKVLIIAIWVIRAVLAVSTGVEVYLGRWEVFFANLFALILTFMPMALEFTVKIKFPRTFEVAMYFSLLLMMGIEKVFEGDLVSIFLGVLLGGVGFILMYVMYYAQKKKNPSNFLVAMFAFCFSVSLGAVWEVFQYMVIELMEVRLEGFYLKYEAQSMLLIMMGAAVISVIGYFYLKFSTQTVIVQLLQPFLKRNIKDEEEKATPKTIKRLIKKGESETLEFKSTIRTNLFTKEQDRKIEQAAVKTLVAFLNTDGGTLLVGVDDKGDIVGIEKDNFRNVDGAHRHFSNLIKNHLGQEFLPFIKTEVIKMKQGNVLKADCTPSDRSVFLKADGNEDFYVRTGPSSVKLEGSKLIAYVNRRFGK